MLCVMGKEKGRSSGLGSRKDGPCRIESHGRLDGFRSVRVYLGYRCLEGLRALPKRRTYRFFLGGGHSRGDRGMAEQVER